MGDTNTIHLYYFGARGRGDPIRLLLEDTGLPYSFHAVNDWPGDKKGNINFSPFGQLPVLHHNGFVLGQSNSILRYVGRVANRGGSNHQESALMDMILDSVEDLRTSYGNVIYGDYEGTVGRFVSKLPDTLKNFENFLNQHNVEYFGLNNFSYPDAALFCMIENIRMKMSPNCLDNFPALNAWFARVSGRQGVSNWVNSKERPTRVNGNNNV